ncbi:CinA family protein [Asticcacaulis excentricus]|uniref:CinA domain protein n=1 Tax=Asticcacaulis excentricus (strain ATCC 15261 / DSM 4724 / KCTC 12464 / NCIMB 9791 / VKM B-1370 / CB 48) TaxID=573065 RepID=E8RSS5_ASTEC|nr:nicotinamide-nucleotide amidohydrolase family protein [Asticcacaulis excentricus]ADU14546.1 CinA domain protein [Asticcacaulis excentricus CB 48]
MDASDLATDILALARAQGRTLATAESCTGGLIAAALTRISGASDVFHEGYVTYSNAAKTKLLGVPEGVLAEHGAVSLPVAHAMAEGALTSAGADLALSVTGIAGPTGGSAEKPVGMVCFGLAFRLPDGEVRSQANVHVFDNLGRDYIREQSVMYALQWALEHLKAEA